MSTTTCHTCGFEPRAGDVFCLNCGSRTVAPNMEQRLEQRVKALEDENAALKVRVAELEEWRDGLDLPDQPADGPARPPILPPYQE